MGIFALEEPKVFYNNSVVNDPLYFKTKVYDFVDDV